MAKETARENQARQQYSGQTGASSPQQGDNPTTPRGAGQYSAYSGTGSGQRSQDVRPWARNPSGARGLSVYDPWSSFGGGPFSMMRRISEEMDRLFENFTGGPGVPSQFGSSGGAATFWAPHIDVSEREGKLVVSADLPGVKREDLSVEIEPDAVTIQGERRQTSTSQERSAYRSERVYGSFYRQIPLPEGTNTENAQATFRDGVLEIEIEVPRKAASRRLEIKDAGGPSSSATQAAGSAQYGSSQHFGSGTQQGDRSTQQASGSTPQGSDPAKR